ncbi:MAG TPA: MAPEG family protein [Caulobacteraceae bacterium]|nr:MAPEG family protein [Caulobacteraceae bacterium]
MTLNPPIVSALTAGILILLQTAFMFAAANQRRQHGPAVGEATDPNMIRAVRRHGNLAENAGIFIASIALLELLSGPSGRLWIEILCGAFVVARLAHGFGLSQQNTTNAFRIGGVILTAFVGVTTGVRLIWLAAPLVLHH